MLDPDFEDEFAPYLPQVVPLLLESCKQADHGVEESEAREFQPYFIL